MIIEGSKAWRDLLGQRGYDSAPKAVPRRRDWLRGVYPAPTYVATFADGQTIRMSFWNRIGKPWDVERGRRLCKSWHRTMTGQDLDIIAGHVEHDGQIQDTTTRLSSLQRAARRPRAVPRALAGNPENRQEGHFQGRVAGTEGRDVLTRHHHGPSDADCRLTFSLAGPSRGRPA